MLNEQEELELENLGERLLADTSDLPISEIERYFELLKIKREEELSEELWNASFLVVNNAIEPNIFNTFEWANNCNEQIKDPLHPSLIADIYPADIEQWKTAPEPAVGLNIIDDYDRGIDTLNSFQKHLSEEAWDSTEEQPFYIKTPTHSTPVELLIAEIRRGNIPDPALLLSLSKAFDLYFASGGTLTLEEVFFGRHKSKDIRSQRKINSFKGISFQAFDHSIRRGEGKSLNELAQRFFRNHIVEHPDSKLIPENVDAFIKKYRRWKASQNSHPLNRD